jgi:hypothetical protein
MPPPKRIPEYREGPAAAQQAESLLHRVLKVPKEELDRRETEYRKNRKGAVPHSRRKS